MDFKKLDDSISKIPFFLEVYLCQLQGRIKSKDVIIKENECSYTKLFTAVDDHQLPDEAVITPLIKQAIDFFKTLALSSDTSAVNILRVDGIKSCNLCNDGLTREYGLIVEYMTEK